MKPETKQQLNNIHTAAGEKPPFVTTNSSNKLINESNYSWELHK